MIDPIGQIPNYIDIVNAYKTVADYLAAHQGAQFATTIAAFGLLTAASGERTYHYRQKDLMNAGKYLDEGKAHLEAGNRREAFKSLDYSVEMFQNRFLKAKKWRAMEKEAAGLRHGLVVDAYNAFARRKLSERELELFGIDSDYEEWSALGSVRKMYAGGELDFCDICLNL